jgi:hypothetical protein
VPALHAVDIAPAAAALAVSTWHERVVPARPKLPYLVTESDRPEDDDREYENKYEHISNTCPMMIRPHPYVASALS